MANTMKETTGYAADIIRELNMAVSFMVDEEAGALADYIAGSRKVFVAGAGRSGLMMRAFAMRLMQMGIDAYVVGETVTPGLGNEDILVIGSGSGETKTLVSIAQKAKSLGGTLAVLTIAQESTLAQLADITVKLPGSPKDQAGSEYATIQPMGALFEQILLIFCDAIILKLMEKQELDSHTMYGRHANLE